MAALSLPTPPMFLLCLGQPSVPIHTWKKMFENYLVTIDATGDRGQRKGSGPFYYRHFVRVCHSEKKVQLLDAPESEVPEIVHVLEVEGKSLRDKIKCTVTIETEEVSPVLIELTVDMGSAVSILPHHLYKQQFSSSPLSPPQVKLVTYSKAPLPVIGCSAHVHFGDAVASTDAAKLRSFLGLTSWYSWFVPNYSSEEKPMRTCVRIVNIFSWTESAQKSFEKLKELIVNSL
ncbi:hypothetical protein QQF64_028861 [Cirrhinus molitorella]|uniref:Uncharacterized protein n=1 Tax=Cirrhinus molitorella TaxID=172907 RepID=A0ABR3N7S5_9TELE